MIGENSCLQLDSPVMIGENSCLQLDSGIADTHSQKVTLLVNKPLLAK